MQKALPEGTVLRGTRNTYTIRRVLGQGTFGITYLAAMRTQVAGALGAFEATLDVTVKEFFMKDMNGREGSTVTASSQGGYFAEYKRKFLREAENLSRLDHPHIVKVLEAFEANGTAYYAMEYLDGGSLDTLIGKRGALTEDEATTYIRQIASALQCMHEHRMLHLDLKPNNVMLRGTGEAVLIDFGLSKQFDETGEPESSTSLGGGTPGYAPLEQTNYQRGDGLPVTMDIYALGATFYKMLTGRRPPEAAVLLNSESLSSLLQQHSISQRMAAIICKAMSPMVKSRYHSVKAFIEALDSDEPEDTIVDDSTQDEATVVVEAEAGQRGGSPAGNTSRRWLTKVAAAVVACLMVIGGFVLWPKFMPESSGEIVTPPTAKTYEVGGVEFKMIPVEISSEGSIFAMGATPEQKRDGWDFERPIHEVTLTHEYSIGQTEVTQALWEAVMGSNPSEFKAPDKPVENVSWDDCQAFITKLNSLTSERFRLPTEAEWEFAARGGSQSRQYRHCGSNTIDDVAWYEDNSGGHTHSVATKAPNELGFYDLNGNVWEWCEDYYADYTSDSQWNPTGPESPPESELDDKNGPYRVVRGGGWDEFLDGCVIARRDGYYQKRGNNETGLRLAL